MTRTSVYVLDPQDRPHLQLQWLDPDTGRRRTRSACTADAAAAERARADLEYELNHGLHREPSRLGWAEFRQAFEREHLSGRRQATRDAYRQTFDCFGRLARPGLLRGVNERALSGYAARLREEGYAPGTIALHFEHLRAALRWAAGQGLVEECPTMPSVKVPRKKPQPVPAEAVERMLALADQQEAAFLLCGWLGGLRLNEALQLEKLPAHKAPWVDWDRRRVVFPAEFAKGDEDQWVPLEPALQGALFNLAARPGRKVFRLGTAKAACERVRRLAERAGVRLTMKTLRAGFACRYAGKVPAQVLQKLMRHADIKTTMGYYANVDEAVEAAVLGRLESEDRGG